MRAGVAPSGWGQGACVGDYDNDGRDDLVRHVLGSEPPVPQPGRRHVRRRDARARAVAATARRWGAGCAFLDYDRDGRLDLVRRQLHRLRSRRDAAARRPACAATRACRSRAGRPACPAARTCSIATAATGRSTTSRSASGITRASGTYGLGVGTLDFDDDGWVDLYVANDSNPSALYRNNRDGTFTDIARSRRLRLQPGRQATGRHGRRRRRLRSQRHDGHLQDELRRRHVDALREHRQRPVRRSHVRRRDRSQHPLARLGRQLPRSRRRRLARPLPRQRPRLSGGRAQIKTEAGYEQRKVVYRNLRNGRFADVSEQLGAPVTTPKASRGAAFADFDNDGDVDIVVNNLHDTPDLFRPGSDWRARTG